MWEGERSWISLGTGVVLFVLGLIPLISSWTGFNLPGFMLTVIGSVAIYVVAAAGLYLLIDMFLEWGEEWAWVSMIVGVIFLALGVIVILNQMGTITFGGSIAGLLKPVIYNVIFVIEGIALAIGSFYMS